MTASEQMPKPAISTRGPSFPGWSFFALGLTALIWWSLRDPPKGDASIFQAVVADYQAIAVLFGLVVFAVFVFFGFFRLVFGRRLYPYMLSVVLVSLAGFAWLMDTSVQSSPPRQRDEYVAAKREVARSFRTLWRTIADSH